MKKGTIIIENNKAFVGDTSGNKFPIYKYDWTTFERETEFETVLVSPSGRIVDPNNKSKNTSSCVWHARLLPRNTAYFLEDKFYHELEDIIQEMHGDEAPAEHIVGLTLMVAELEPTIYKDITAHDIADYLADRFEDRSDEEGDVWDKIEKILKESIDFDKLNINLKKVRLYYPIDEEYTITEEDYKNAVEPNERVWESERNTNSGQNL